MTKMSGKTAYVILWKDSQTVNQPIKSDLTGILIRSIDFCECVCVEIIKSVYRSQSRSMLCLCKHIHKSIDGAIHRVI